MAVIPRALGGHRQDDWRLPAPMPKYVRVHVGSKGIFGPRRFMDVLGLALFLAAFCWPLVNPNAYYLSIGTSAAIFVMLASGLNVVVGYAGLLDLGYVAFFAVGAYASGIMSTRYHWDMLPTIPVVLACCVVAGVVIGGPTLRLRSDYLAIVTLGFGEIIRRVAQNVDITGGATGIYGIKKFSFLGLDLSQTITVFGFDLAPNVSFYMFTVACMGIAVVAAARLAKGRMGRAWQAVRDDEDAAEAMGINTYTTKLTAYIAGAIWGGMAGMLQGAHVGGISPTQFMFLNSALILMAVVMGGMGSTPGVIIGGLVISLLPEFLREAQNARYLLFGLALVAVMVFRPKGLWPANWHLPFLGAGRTLRTDVLVEPPVRQLDDAVSPPPSSDQVALRAVPVDLDDAVSPPPSSDQVALRAVPVDLDDAVSPPSSSDQVGLPTAPVDLDDAV
ncbi:MAG: branched-chain amino acid ABC transporter permease, partial [Bifidobacteriaceae bacterium]|nr:branched-chain amino acid ABC transporter permease [Bifidobacteriaceae bacterium]